MTVTLYRLFGENNQTEIEVVTVTLPSFNVMPEIVCWGSRLFIWDGTKKRYIEAEYFIIPGNSEVQHQLRVSK